MLRSLESSTHSSLYTNESTVFCWRVTLCVFNLSWLYCNAMAKNVVSLNPFSSLFDRHGKEEVKFVKKKSNHIWSLRYNHRWYRYYCRSGNWHYTGVLINNGNTTLSVNLTSIWQWIWLPDIWQTTRQDNRQTMSVWKLELEVKIQNLIL